MYLQVFDYDWGLSDDFMGMTSLDPSRLPLNKQTELSLILTETNTPGTEYMGEIVLSLTLVPRTLEEKEIVNICHLTSNKVKVVLKPLTLCLVDEWGRTICNRHLKTCQIPNLVECTNNSFNRSEKSYPRSGRLCYGLLCQV